MTEVDPFDFIAEVWRRQPHEEGYVFVSFKEGDGWRDLPLKLRRGRVRPPTLPVDADVYFCPNVFKEARRQREHALPSTWLHADLDEVDPYGLELPATAAWLTSKGRYQCLWGLTKEVSVKHFEALNQRLTYLTAADLGGWSITKVLRVPGTFNHKRGKPERVDLLWDDGELHRVKTVLELVRDVEVVRQAAVEDLEISDLTASAVYHKYKASLPNDVRRLIVSKTARGDRSARLWQLECGLVAAGVPKKEALVLLRKVVWNKYAGQGRELPQLWKELCKAEAHVKSHRKRTRPKETRGNKDVASRNGRVREKPKFHAVDLSKFLATERPRKAWTVESCWSHDAHGLIAGEPKTYKSIIATDLAVSVASGTKFLGEFEVPEKGHVIMVQEENDAAMVRDRFLKILEFKGLTGSMEPISTKGLKVKMQLPPTLPMTLLNNAGFNLTLEDDLQYLADMIVEKRAKLCILDPVYLMTPGIDENSAVQMTPILKALLDIKHQTGCGMMLIHHYNKPREGDDRHPGNRISGSSVFYRWFDSAIYLEKGTEPQTVRMTAEHRGNGRPGIIDLEIAIEEEYDVAVEVTKESNVELRSQLKRYVHANPGVKLTDLMEQLGIGRDRAERMIDRCGFMIVDGESQGKRGRPPKIVLPG